MPHVWPHHAQGLSLVALAGDPSPWRLPAAALDPLVKLMGDLVAGEGAGFGTHHCHGWETCCCAVCWGLVGPELHSNLQLLMPVLLHDSHRPMPLLSLLPQAVRTWLLRCGMSL